MDIEQWGTTFGEKIFLHFPDFGTTCKKIFSYLDENVLIILYHWLQYTQGVQIHVSEDVLYIASFQYKKCYLFAAVSIQYNIAQTNPQIAQLP